MRVIVAGSRTVTSYREVEAAIISSGFEPTVIISGTAKGVDQLGEQYAKIKGLEILRFPADWNRYGKSAGYRRNVEMAEVADALVAVWDGESKGTKHMIDIANRNGLKVYVYFSERAGNITVDKLL